MMKGMTAKRLRTLLTWALMDLRGELRLSALTAVLIAGLLAPAMVMSIARVSVIEGWTSMLTLDPRNREVVIIGEYDIVQPKIEALEALDNLGFYVRETSRFIKSIRFVGATGGRARMSDVRTTKDGDPILGGLAAPLNDEIVLTENAALKVGLKKGDTLTVLLRREPGSAPVEVLEISLTVSGIVPSTVWPEELVLMSEARSGGIALWSQRPGDPTPPLYDRTRDIDIPWKSLRVYAGQVAQAPDLQETLRAPPFAFDTQLNSDQVFKMVTLSQGLQALSWALVGLSAIGFAVAILLLQRLGVARKSETLALMFVAGMSRRDMTVFLLFQSFVLALLGMVLTVFVLILLQPAIVVLAQSLTPNVPPAGMDWSVLGTGTFGALFIALVFSLWASRDIRLLDFPRLLRSD
jgi:hypothetical protein